MSRDRATFLACLVMLLSGSCLSARAQHPGPPGGWPAQNYPTRPAAQPQQPAGPLHTIANSDNTATLSVPDGWKLTDGSHGAIEVVGPGNAALHLGFVIPGIFDTVNPQARQNAMLAARDQTPGILCPHDGVSLSTSYRCVLDQKRKNARLKPSTLHLLTSHDAPPSPPETEAMLIEANTFVDDGTGPMESTLRVGRTDMTSAGVWNMTLSAVQAPNAFFEQNRTLLAAMVSSYRRNGRPVASEIQPLLDNIASRGSAAPTLPSAHDLSPPK